ncbi:hypothetical protein J4526_08540 [Desulfurococcaceae archaeon MEX13E-LK6-19]|nr:hypothetical protein J4526_08540 [Desulfurococcaceae archaeon MEX13E-LK6-19]
MRKHGYLFVSLILVILLTSTTMHIAFGVLEYSSVGGKELYHVYNYGDVIVFRVNRRVFTYVNGNFYVYISSTPNEFSSQIDEITGIVFEKNQMLIPPGFDLNNIDLDYAEKNKMNLSTVMNLLSEREDPYIVFSYFNTSISGLIKYKVVARYFHLIGQVDAEKLGNSVSSFKTYLLRIVKSKSEAHSIHYMLRKFMNSHGVRKYDVEEMIVVDDNGIKENIIIYIDNVELPTNLLEELGRQIKNSFKQVNTVIILDQPWSPYSYYYLHKDILSPQLYHVLKNEIPCFNGIGSMQLYIDFIHLRSDCVIDMTNGNTGLEEFINKIVFKLQNIEEYGDLFKQGAWLIIIEPRTTITAQLPSTGEDDIEDNETAGAVDNSLYTIIVIAILLSAISSMLIAKKYLPGR